MDGDKTPALSPQEEEKLRKEARERLEAETEHRTLDNGLNNGGIDVSSELRRAHRLRVIREEEDAFYAERGLFRYRNHRGEVEWLPQDEIARRKASHRKRRGSTSLRRIAQWLPSGEFFAFVLVIAVLAAVFRYSRDGKTPKLTANYEVSVLSTPPGAAVFIDGVSSNLTTNVAVPISGQGKHVLSVARPGFRALPPSITVEMTDGSPRAMATFTLYPLRTDTAHPSTN